MSIENLRKQKVRRLAFDSLEARVVLSSPDQAPSLGPPPPASASVVWVNTEAALQNAFNNLQSGQTVVIQKGTYNLSNTLYLGKNRAVTNVTIRGESDNFNDVVLLGKGMDNAGFGNVPMGISVYNAQGVTIADLSIGQVYYSPIELKGDAGASQVQVYHTRLFDAGEQFLKSNPGASVGGVNNSSVKYSLIEYTAGPPRTDHGGGVGYTNGIDVHAGQNWDIADNLIRNLHTPDSASTANYWNPAILIWNNSSNVTVERNTIIDCDRAIAMGLVDRSGFYDAQNGIVRNNFVYMSPGLLSTSRKAGADAAILAWDSPGTKVLQNSLLLNGNEPNSIQTRFTPTGIQILNNLADVPFRDRDGATVTQVGNYWGATTGMFANPASGDLHLVSNGATQANVINKVTATVDAPDDWGGTTRPTASNGADIGADEYGGSTASAPSVIGASPSSAATGVAPGVPVSATFSVPVVASSVVFTLKDGSGNPVAGTTGYDDASRTSTFTPTSSLSASTTYTASVSGAVDGSGNEMTSACAWSFTTAAATTSGRWTQTSAADFNAGTQSATVVSNNAGGEVQLAPSFSDDFSGGALGSSWSTSSYGPGAGFAVSGGILSVSGGAAYSKSTFPGVPVEGLLNIGAAAYQHFGLATGLASVGGNSWAIFSTMGTTNALYARVNSNGATSDVAIGSLPAGYHDYLVKPVSTGYQFLVDGVLKASVARTTPAGTPMMIAISSLNASTSTSVRADWVRADSYPSSGTFTSSVLDAGRTAGWGALSWTASQPPGTSVVVETSSSTDGTNWSSWSAASSGGNVASPAGRFLRYRVRLATTDPTATATFSDITINWS
jgi:hypothetical protein